MKSASDLTVTDLFAGAGGSSTGAALIPGVRIRVASNHCQLAVDVHGSEPPAGRPSFVEMPTAPGISAIEAVICLASSPTALR